MLWKMLTMTVLMVSLLSGCAPVLRLGGDVVRLVNPPKTCLQLDEAGEQDYFACMFARGNIAGY